LSETLRQDELVSETLPRQQLQFQAVIFPTELPFLTTMNWTCFFSVDDVFLFNEAQ
jgi:hypothetical protein